MLNIFSYYLDIEKSTTIDAMQFMDRDMPEPHPTKEVLANCMTSSLHPSKYYMASRQHNKKYLFIESKTVMAILESDFGATPERFLEGAE